MSNPIPTNLRTTPSSYAPRAGSVTARILDLFRREPARLHSYSTIAEDIGSSTASVQVRLSQLRGRGVIEKLLSVHGQGGGSQYRVLAPQAVQNTAAE